MKLSKIDFRVIEFDNCWSVEKVVYNENEEVVSHTSDRKLCVIAKPRDGSRNYYGTMHSLASKLKVASNLEPIKEIKLKEKKSDGDSKKRKVSAPNKGSSSKS